VIIARSVDKLEALKKELETKHKCTVTVIAKDLTLLAAPQEIYDELQRKNITIDYLINNAGFGGLGKFHERTWSDDLAMINLNIIALTALTRLFLPNFVERKSGRILNVSSTACLLPGPLQAVYYATKAYVTSFSNAIAEELSDTKVTVTTLMPGATDTAFAKTSGMDKTPLFDHSFTPQEVAKDGYNGMLKGKLDIIAGVTAAQKVMFAAVPFTPKSIVLKQVRRMQEVKK